MSQECMPQAQLSEVARGVLEVSEERFKGLAKELARRELFVKHNSRKTQLERNIRVVLGRISEGERWYGVDVEMPYCRERYGDSRGVLRVHVTASDLLLERLCIAAPTSGITISDTINFWRIHGEYLASPERLYELYKFLYKELGIGDRPLLDLAEKIEQRDKDVAGILKKLYTVLETLNNKIREIEQTDYSQVVEKKIKQKVEEAAELLRKAKELAKKGDTKGLSDLLKTVVFEAPPYVATLGDIINYLRTGSNNNVTQMLRIYNPNISVFADILREEAIYDAALTAAEHAGFETRWE